MTLLIHNYRILVPAQRCLYVPQQHDECGVSGQWTDTTRCVRTGPATLKVAHCSFQGGLYSCEMTYIPGADTMISWRFGGEMEDIWGSWSKDNVRLKRCEHVYSQLTSALGHCGPQRKNDLYSRRPHYVFLKVWGRNGRYVGVLVKRQCSFEECEQYFTVRYIVIYSNT